MALVESIVSFTVEKIGEQLIQEAVFLHRVRGQVESIQRELKRMQCFLKAADQKRKEGDDRVKNWVVEVRDVAYDAEDAIEMFIMKVEIKRRRGLVQKCVFFFNDLLSLHKIGVKIEDAKSKIGEIFTSRSTYGIPEISGGDGPTSTHRRLLEFRQNAALAEDDNVVGFERDADALVARLTNGVSRRLVVSIVAMGGAGKTTIANKVYKTHDVRNHFGGFAAWVCVSQNYSVKELLRDIAEQVMKMSKQDSAELNVKALQETLSQFLKERTYLIVLDDIWENDAWDQLIAAFPDGMCGSRIMLTTRIMGVAVHADRDPANPPYQLPLLSPEESWMLFLKKAFPWKKDDETSCPLELEELGRQIVAKCNGLPLAVAVTGGLLSAKGDNISDWSNVLSSLDWQLSQDSVHCSDILALSYYELPHYLKPCFLYLGLFPEDCQVSVKKLMRLWVAEGFIQRRGQETVEDVAEDCFLELIGRSVIQVAERRFDGSVKTCRIHDLLRELSISKAREDHFFEFDPDSIAKAPSGIRRLAIHEAGHLYDSVNHPPLKLRSLLCFTESLPKLLDGSAKFLRVLDLERVDFLGDDRLATLVGALVHLKYLNLKDTDITRLPLSISKLYYLETVNLARVFHVHLPKAIWTMHRLRHLHANSCVFDGCPQLKHLRNLQTLSLYAGSWIEEDSLSTLTNLRKLRVSGYLKSYHNVLSRSIEKLVNLRSLTLDAPLYGEGDREPILPPLMPFTPHLRLYKMILLGCLKKLPHPYEFPPNLTMLTLERSALKQDPMATLEKLQNLQILKLGDEAYCGKKMISSARGFPRLRYLKLQNLFEVKEWIIEEGAMPALVSLSVNSCALEMIPEGLQNVTTLQELKINGMTTAFLNRLQESDGEDWYKIQHIPSIDFPR